ncbi:PAS domain S-box [Archaeoglobus sulfaticallidus PM70-1]|uniref:histidine kinase n=1 Tax=Archaeoglobus sulfaticallidus PM70-1 TaxID=387631 RepID=N0BIC3_9EURY|nr:PAS domain S-box protein [Archaeoglobus sulfaticallidus]AGK60216.1 PAS domain S-box [Archaeoglobus sulfaticallidus PM70-1]
MEGKCNTEIKELIPDVFEVMNDAVVITNIAGKILFVNKEFERITGFKREEVVGKAVTGLEIRPEEMKDRVVKEIMPELMEKGYVRNVEGLVRRRDGTEVHVLISLSLMRDADGKPTHTVRVIRDITDIKKLEERKRRAERALRVLSRVNEEIVRVGDEKELLERVCKVIVEEGGYAYTWIGYAESDKTVRPVAKAGIDGYADVIKVTWDESETGKGPTGSAIRMGKPAIVRDIETDPVFTPWRDFALKRGFASSIALPLIHGDSVFGALNIYSSERDAFDGGETELLKKLSENLSYAIAVLREKKVKERMEVLYGTIVENTGTALVIIDEDTTVKFANHEAEKLYGQSKEELVGKSWMEFIPEEEIERLMRYHKLRQIDPTLAPSRYETKIVDVKGNVKNVFITASMVSAEQCILSIIDITEMKKLEKELVESEIKYKTLFEKSPIGVVLTGTDMTVLDCNESALKIFGMDRDVIGRKWPDLGIFHHEDLPRILEEFYRGVQDKIFELKLKVTVEGREKWIKVLSVLIEKDGKPYAFLSMIHDITEDMATKKEMEKMIKQLDLLYSIDLGILSVKPFDKILKESLRGLREIVDYDLACIAVYSGSEVKTLAEPEISQNIQRLFADRNIEVEMKKVDGILELETLSRLEVELLKNGMKSYIVLPLIARDERIGSLMLASKKIISDDDFEFVKSLVNQFAIALHEAVLFEQRKVAYKQIEDNIEKFAILVDHIRNPLAAISGLAETRVDDEETRELILSQVERIVDTVERLDRGWLESELIRNFLKRSGSQG